MKLKSPFGSILHSQHGQQWHVGFDFSREFGVLSVVAGTTGNAVVCHRMRSAFGERYHMVITELTVSRLLSANVADSFIAFVYRGVVYVLDCGSDLLGATFLCTLQRRLAPGVLKSGLIFWRAFYPAIRVLIAFAFYASGRNLPVGNSKLVQRSYRSAVGAFLFGHWGWCQHHAFSVGSLVGNSTGTAKTRPVRLAFGLREHEPLKGLVFEADCASSHLSKHIIEPSGIAAVNTGLVRSKSSVAFARLIVIAVSACSGPTLIALFDVELKRRARLQDFAVFAGKIWKGIIVSSHTVRSRLTNGLGQAQFSVHALGWAVCILPQEL